MSRKKTEIHLAGYEDIFSDEREISGTASGTEQVVKIDIREFRSFRNHPFRVINDAKMQETVESVKQYGVLMPGLVRPDPEGGYEVIAGHRRWMACELAGLTEMPVIVRELSDDEATILMVDTNIQREDILPSEKAKAYAMKAEAMKHQGSKGEKFTADLVGEAAGESGRTVQRYIRLASLCEELLTCVDQGKIPLGIGEKLSYLKPEEQEALVQVIEESDLIPCKGQAEKLKEISQSKGLELSDIYAVMIRKEKTAGTVAFSAKIVRQYFPPEYTAEQVKEVICQLLEEWKAKQE